MSTFLSLWRGFAREALSLVGWIAGFSLAALFAERFAEHLVGFIDNDSARYVTAYAMIVVAVLMLSNIFAVVVGQLIRLTGLGVLDRPTASSNRFLVRTNEVVAQTVRLVMGVGLTR